MTTNQYATSSIDNTNEYTLAAGTTISIPNGQGIVDMSYIPYMRGSTIDVLGYNLRPRRQVYPFFDTVNMSRFWQRPNKIVLDARKAFNDLKYTIQESVSFLNGNAQILLAETNDSNTILYITDIEGPTGNVYPGNTVIGWISGLSANVVSYEHATGRTLANAASNSQITLSLDADAVTENIYTGNTITILSGNLAGETSNIISYNASTRLANVSPTFSGIPESNVIYSIGDSRKSYASNTIPALYTTDKGFIAGRMFIPDPDLGDVKFPTGDRIIRIIDNDANDLTDYTTIANYRFISNGLKIKYTQMTGAGTDNVIIRNVSTSGGEDYSGIQSSTGQGPDGTLPFAYSFYVNPVLYPNGFFIPYIDVFFKNKSETTGIGMQLRPMVNGEPSSIEILPNAVAYVEADDVVISDSPNTSNTATATRFTFPHPIYVKQGLEYAWVLDTNSLDYDVYVSELGEKIIGSDRIVSQQPNLGSIFKSQSGQTYTPIQSEDAMCIIYKCLFENSGSLIMNESKGAYTDSTSVARGNDVYADQMQIQSEAAELPGTSVTYSYKSTSNSSNTLDTSYTSVRPYKDFPLSERAIIKKINTPQKTMLVKMDLATDNPDVSPVIFSDRQQVIALQNRINNMGIQNSHVAIANVGSGYTQANTYALISGPTGSGANAYITANATTGAIETLVIDSPGSGYYDNVEVSIVSTDGSGANVIITHEMRESGGIATARQISKTVTLADDLSAGDLRVYLTAYRPVESNVQVYYKVRNSLDPVTIEELSWKKMEQYTSPYLVSEKFPVVKEYEYRPSLTSNAVSYQSSGGTYSTFNQYKIKIVLASSATHPFKIPYLTDAISVAVPADEF